MSSNNITHGLSRQLSELTDINHSMLKNAEAGNWDKVMDAEISRSKMLEALYSTSNIHNTPGIVSATREMILINQELEKLAKLAHASAATEVISINRGRSAINAYEKNLR